VIFDIGANTGIYSLVAKCLNPEAKVVAFEPVERVYHKLEHNIKLNNYDITSVKKAAADNDGTAYIFDTDSEHVYSVTVNKNLSLPETPVTKRQIEIIKLSTYIQSHNVHKIDLMKIDVETFEAEVLQGLQPYLGQFRPTLLIEILTDEVAANVQKLLTGLDYIYFNIDEEKGVRRVKELSPSSHYNYLICSPLAANELSLS
jgi:FkbM family methyltransferase